MATAETVQGACFEVGNKHPISTVKWIATRMGTGQVLSISVKRVVPNRKGRPSLINFCEKGGAK